MQSIFASRKHGEGHHAHHAGRDARRAASRAGSHHDAAMASPAARAARDGRHGGRDAQPGEEDSINAMLEQLRKMEKLLQLHTDRASIEMLETLRVFLGGVEQCGISRKVLARFHDLFHPFFSMGTLEWERHRDDFIKQLTRFKKVVNDI